MNLGQSKKITSPITAAQFQVLVDSEDDEMTIGIVDLIATDNDGDTSGTLKYYLIKDGLVISGIANP